MMKYCTAPELRDSWRVLGSAIRCRRWLPQPLTIEALSVVLRRSPPLRDSLHWNDAGPAATGWTAM